MNELIVYGILLAGCFWLTGYTVKCVKWMWDQYREYESD